MTPSDATAPVRELAWRAVALGGAITLVFTAANVSMGLKIGLTFATSIPAAVISMSVLRWFADASILEHNIVQTIASAAGTLAAIIFVLPGLVMIGAWSSFPFTETATITAAGGILGVMSQCAAPGSRRRDAAALSGRQCGGRGAAGRCRRARRREPPMRGASA